MVDDASPGPAGGHAPRLEVLKALGDNTRYAIYLEIARSARPRTTAEVADTLDLHPNTVRPHLERMRDLGLLEVSAVSTGAVGRPQHRYALAADAPSLGLEPPVVPLLTRTLLEAAAAAGLGADDVIDAGRSAGRDLTAGFDGTDAIDELERWLDEVGFDPARIDDEHEATIAFTHCPFRELAEAHPDLVCSVHRAMIEGFLDRCPDVEVTDFRPLPDREPCRVTVSLPAASGTGPN